MEAKQVAQQQAERGKYVVLRALEEKKSTIIKAQGEAEAAKLVSPPIADAARVICSRPYRLVFVAPLDCGPMYLWFRL